MAGNPGATNSNVPNEPEEPSVRVLIGGKEVEQTPSPMIPVEIVNAVTEMHRISTESEDAQ